MEKKCGRCKQTAEIRPEYRFCGECMDELYYGKK